MMGFLQSVLRSEKRSHVERRAIKERHSLSPRSRKGHLSDKRARGGTYARSAVRSFI